jgi:hypothetical protein
MNDPPKKKPSGEEVRKRAKEKCATNEELLKKIPKLSSFFPSKATGPMASDTDSAINLPSTSQSSFPSTAASECASVSADNTSVDLVLDTQEAEPIGIPEGDIANQNTFFVPDNDPAEWHGICLP